MPPSAGPAMMRVAAVIPVVLLVLFTGLLWLLGLMCDRERRSYVTNLSCQAMEAIGALLHGPPALPPVPTHAHAASSGPHSAGLPPTPGANGVPFPVSYATHVPQSWSLKASPCPSSLGSAAPQRAGRGRCH